MGDRVTYFYIYIYYWAHELSMMSFEHIGYVFGSYLSIVTSIKISRYKEYKTPRLISFEILRLQFRNIIFVGKHKEDLHKLA